MSEEKTYVLFKFIRPLLALIIVLGAFIFLFVLVYRSVPSTNQNIIALAAGYVLGIVSMVAAYYFGTSKDKSDAEQVLRKPNQTTTITSSNETANGQQEEPKE